MGPTLSSRVRCNRFGLGQQLALLIHAAQVLALDQPGQIWAGEGIDSGPFAGEWSGVAWAGGRMTSTPSGLAIAQERQNGGASGFR